MPPTRVAALLRTPGFAASLRQGLAFGLVAGAPMVVMASVVHDEVAWDFKVFEGSVLAPLVEETFFRGMLVAVPVAAALGVFARFGISRYLKSRLYLGDAGGTDG